MPTLPLRRLGRQREGRKVLSWVRTEGQQFGDSALKGEHQELSLGNWTGPTQGGSVLPHTSLVHTVVESVTARHSWDNSAAPQSYPETAGESRQVLGDANADAGRSPQLWGRPCPECAARTNQTHPAHPTQGTHTVRGTRNPGVYSSRVFPHGRARGSFSLQPAPEAPDSLRSSGTRSRKPGGSVV